MNDRIISAAPAAIEHAARRLSSGQLTAFPTETVYGLGADATNPLIVHVTGLEAAEAVAEFDERARRLAAHFWPGPLSLVLRRRGDSGLSLLASAGLDTVAIRAPAHPVAQALLRAVGKPIAAPSANRSGRVSPTEAAHVAAELGDAVALILDGGHTAIGVESTVLDLTGEDPLLLRPGGVTLEELEDLLGPVATTSTAPAKAGAPRSPGMLASHYAPSSPLRLGATEARPGEALLAFGPSAPPGFAETLWLSRSGDLAEAAANLFAMLRQLDCPAFAGIAVMPIPEHGLGHAINDRLARAAVPRSG
jgi:L-threonylcarbamoyladenylate synthase